MSKNFLENDEILPSFIKQASVARCYLLAVKSQDPRLEEAHRLVKEFLLDWCEREKPVKEGVPNNENS